MRGGGGGIYRGFLRGAKATLHDIIMMHICHYKFSQMHRMCNTQRVNSNVNYGPWVIIMCVNVGSAFILKSTILVSDG